MSHNNFSQTLINIKKMKNYLKVLFITQIVISISADAHNISGAPELSDDYLKLISEASSDVYDDPTDGLLTENQIIEFIKISDNAIRIYAEEFQDNNHPSDNTSEVYCDRRKYQAAKIVAVKSNGFNWAEFEWVRRQLKQISSLQNIASLDFDNSAAGNIRLSYKYRGSIARIQSFC